VTDLGEAAFWNQRVVAEYYESNRLSTKHIYPSEWHYLKELLREGMSVLDIGCAVGGFVAILAEHLRDFRYTGVDLSNEMIQRAKQKYPAHRFHIVKDTDLSVLHGEAFDLVVCLGVLHLSRHWRHLVQAAWDHTRTFLLLDMRETYVQSIEDDTRSYITTDFCSSPGRSSDLILPYNIINSAEAVKTLVELCPGWKSFRHYGYLNHVSPAVTTPVRHVFMNTYCIEKHS
jgi:SAM-dependent methyltransferase